MKKNIVLLLAGLSVVIPRASFAIDAPTNFTVTSSGDSISLSWTNPVDPNFDVITLRRSTSSYPTHPTEWDVSTWWPMTSHIETSLQDNTYYYTIFARDLSGNVSDGVTGFAIVDTTAPIISAYSPSGSLTSWVVYFTRNVEDQHANGGSLQFLISGDPLIQGLAYQHTIFPTDTGSAQTLMWAVDGLWDQVRYRASTMVDAFGNHTSTPSTMFEVDGTHPTLNYAGDIPNGWSMIYGDDVVVGAEASDAHLSGGTIRLYLREDPNFDPSDPIIWAYHETRRPTSTSGSVSFDASVLATGTYYWYAEATDIVGNQTSWAIQYFKVNSRRSGWGAGGAASSSRTSDTCPSTDLSPSNYDGLCFDSNGTPLSHREKILKLLNPNATPSDTGDYVTVAGFIRDVFALLNIPLRGTMPEAYQTTPISEKLFNKIINHLTRIL